MTPVLITAPVDPVVTLDDLKQHLRIDYNDDDDLIEQLQASAVAHLDGWNGQLGRCIMPQTWAVNLTCGMHVLPFPDVTGAVLDPDGDNITLNVVLKEDGATIDLDRDGQVNFSCAMPPTLLPAAQVAVKMWVADAYQNREASEGGQGIAFQTIVRGLRSWGL
jgi:uncharacterized phiE125 gp8 family phage protein